MANAGARCDFEFVYVKHVRSILAYCLRRTGEAEAHDATAEVFATAWRRVSEIPDEPATLPWLYVVAANVLRNQQRSARRRTNLVNRVGLEPASPTNGPEAEAMDRAEKETVRRAITALKPKYRDVIQLVEWEGLSRKQVADIMGVSRSTIDQRMHRAYAQLAKKLQPTIAQPGKGGPRVRYRTS